MSEAVDERESGLFRDGENGNKYRNSALVGNGYQSEAEWIERYEPGVYITPVAPQDGTRDQTKHQFLDKQVCHPLHKCDNKREGSLVSTHFAPVVRLWSKKGSCNCSFLFCLLFALYIFLFWDKYFLLITPPFLFFCVIPP